MMISKQYKNGRRGGRREGEEEPAEDGVFVVEVVVFLVGNIELRGVLVWAVVSQPNHPSRVVF